MESIIKNSQKHMIVENHEIINKDKSSFIEANTEKVLLKHLKEDCIIPVFARDNETTISHYDFINEAWMTVKAQFSNMRVNEPQIRVSHVVKGRIPTAIGKPVTELLEHEKTIYYERCAFVMEIPEILQNVNGNNLSLSIGGVRAYNEENLYGKKSPEKFKLFIGFKNLVCTNLCISTDGFMDKIKVSSILELKNSLQKLIVSYDKENHLEKLKEMTRYKISENQFAHLIGKLKMFNNEANEVKSELFNHHLNDRQINCIIRDYHTCENFGKSTDGMISLWELYNLLTEANKSSYVESNFIRNVNCYELVNHLVNGLKTGSKGYYLI